MQIDVVDRLQLGNLAEVVIVGVSFALRFRARRINLNRPPVRPGNAVVYLDRCGVALICSAFQTAPSTRRLMGR
jgi:hypothetical protein